MLYKNMIIICQNLLNLYYNTNLKKFFVNILKIKIISYMSYDE